jgi:hypothetical protein
MFDDRDVDRELAILVDEFLRAIERIDQGEAMTVFGHLAVAEGFLGDDGQIGFCLGQALQNQRLGALVGFGDRGRISLAIDIEIALIDVHDEFAGVERNSGELVC